MFIFAMHDISIDIVSLCFEVRSGSITVTSFNLNLIYLEINDIFISVKDILKWGSACQGKLISPADNIAVV